MAGFAPSDDSIELYINSLIDKRPQDTPSDFLIDFSTSIRLENQQSYQIAVKTFAAPNTAPQFADDELVFSVLQSGQTDETLNIQVDKVYGSTADFLSDLQTKLNALTGVNVNVVVDADTRRVKITNNSVGYLRLYMSKFWKKVGFTDDQITADNYIQIDASENVLSTNATLLVRTQRYLLCSRNVYNNAIVKDNNYSQVMAILDLEGAWGTYNSEEPNYLWYHDITNSNNIDSLSFYLLDDQRRPIQNLYGGGVQLSLIIRKMKK